MGRLSRALISKLVKRKGEGAAAEGYKVHIRPLDSSEKTKIHDTGRSCEVITYNNSERIFLGQPRILTWPAEELVYARGSVSSSWSGLVFLAEVRSFFFSFFFFDSGLV